jgi:N-ethylmaleimide reductase
MAFDRSRGRDRVRRKFLANPDLSERSRAPPLNLDDPSTYYGVCEVGYIDYLTLTQQRGDQSKPWFDTRSRSNFNPSLSPEA